MTTNWRTVLLVALVTGIVGILLGASVSQVLLRKHHGIAMELQLSKEWALLDAFANKTFQTQEPGQHLLVHQLITSIADARREVQWMSQQDYDRTVGFSNARIAVLYLDQGERDKATPYLGTALRLLNEERVKPLTEGDLVELMQQVRQAPP